MTDDIPPRLFEILRADLATFRTEVNARLDRAVSADAFAAEQRRVDDRFSAQGREIGELRASQAKVGAWVRWAVGFAISLPAAGVAFQALVLR